MAVQAGILLPYCLRSATIHLRLKENILTNDLKIIKGLKKKIGKKLKKAGLMEVENLFLSGFYTVNEENRVIGLNLARTELTNGLEELMGLSDLVSLNLYDNQISDIYFLKYLTNLTTLVLSDNQISDISFLKKLVKLTRLDLRNNRIKQLPRWVVNWDMEISWDEYSGLRLENNPLKIPPIEILKKGKEAVSEYFNAVKCDGSTGKIALVKQNFSVSF